MAEHEAEIPRRLTLPSWASQEELQGSVMRRFQARMPRPVYLSEAREVADFAERHATALATARLPSQVAAEMRWLCDRLGLLAPALRRKTTPESQEARDAFSKGRALYRRIDQLMAFYGEVNGEEAILVSLANARAIRSRTRRWTRTHLAEVLHSYIYVARKWSEALEGFGGFDPTSLDVGDRYVSLLRQGPDDQKRRAGQRRHCEMCFHLLDTRLKRVRATARLVFHDQPEVLAEVRSQWAHRQRARQRAKRTA